VAFATQAKRAQKGEKQVQKLIDCENQSTQEEEKRLFQSERPNNEKIGEENQEGGRNNQPFCEHRN